MSYLLSNCLSSSISHHSPLFSLLPSVCLLSIPLSASFLYPLMLYSLSDSLLFALFLCHTAPYHPPVPFPLYFPHYPTPSFLFSLLPFLAFLCSGSICSHYIDGPDDSVEWCTLSPVLLHGLPLQLAHTAALNGSFSVGTMTARHLLLSPVTPL